MENIVDRVFLSKYTGFYFIWNFKILKCIEVKNSAQGVVYRHFFVNEKIVDKHWMYFKNLKTILRVSKTRCKRLFT